MTFPNSNETLCITDRTLHFKCCYKSVRYWYQPDGGARANLTTFLNNNLTSATPNPFSGVTVANFTYPAIVGADIEFYDTDIAGTTTTPQGPTVNGSFTGCCNYTRDVPSNLPVSLTVTANVTSPVSSVRLIVPVSGTAPTPPPRTDVYPGAVKLTAALTYPPGPSPDPAQEAWAQTVIKAMADGVTVSARVTTQQCGIYIDYPEGEIIVPASNGYSATRIILRTGSADGTGGGNWFTGYTQLSNGKQEAVLFGQPFVYGWIGPRKGHAEIVIPGTTQVSNAKFQSYTGNPCGFAATLSLTASGPASKDISINGVNFRVTSISRADA